MAKNLSKVKDVPEEIAAGLKHKQKPGRILICICDVLLSTESSLVGMAVEYLGTMLQSDSDSIAKLADGDGDLLPRIVEVMGRCEIGEEILKHCLWTLSNYTAGGEYYALKFATQDGASERVVNLAMSFN